MFPESTFIGARQRGTSDAYARARNDDLAVPIENRDCDRSTQDFSSLVDT